jgi:hypothetical protein
MERVCFTLRVRHELQDEYKSRHEPIWLPMLREIALSGCRNYTFSKQLWPSLGAAIDSASCKSSRGDTVVVVAAGTLNLVRKPPFHCFEPAQY